MLHLTLPLALALVALTGSSARAQGRLISKVGLPVTNPGETIQMPANTSMWCVAASGPMQGARVALRRCQPLAPGGAVREWSVPAKSTGPIRHVASRLCVDARQSDQALILWSCHGGWNQQFTNTAADELKLDRNNMCVTVADGTPTSGPSVHMAPCRGDATQAFYRTN